MKLRSRRGQPLVALGAIMAMWVAVRAWGPMDALLEVPLPLPPSVAGRVDASPPPAPAPRQAVAQDVALQMQSAPPPVRNAEPEQIQWPTIAKPAPPRKQPESVFRGEPAPMEPNPKEPEPRRIILEASPVPFGAVPPEVRARRRWSADAWMLWREKGEAGAALVGGGTYGASQAGAVLRYRIAPGSSFDPRAYFRATTTLSGEREVEGAAGIAVRPIKTLPLDLMVEGRALRFFGDPRLRPSETRIRPAAMAVIGPPPVIITNGFRAEAYAQAGYVGGEGASAFADGQLRVVRDVPALPPGRFRLDAGLGAWGGVQSGVRRVDVGPSAALRFPVGRGVFGRASVDWRQRVYGDAQPGSGPVVTISAGF